MTSVLPKAGTPGGPCRIAAVLAGIALSSSALSQTLSAGPDKLVARACTNDCEQTHEKLAVDRAGNAIAIWMEPPGDVERRIIVARYDAATNRWGPSTPLFGETGKSPQIAFDAQGNALAVWSSSLPEAEHALRYSRYLAAQGTWTAPATANLQQSPESVDDLILAVGKNGDAVVSYTGRNYSQFVTRFDGDTRTWSAPVHLDAFVAALAVDPAGNAIAVDNVASTSGDHGRLVAYRYDAATKAWTLSRVLEDYQPAYGSDGIPLETETFASIALAMDDYGSAMVFWQKVLTPSNGGAPTRTIRSARYLASHAAWSDKTVPKISGDKTGGASLSADRSANVVAVWTQFVGAYQKTVSARYSSTTGAWSAPRPIQSGNFNTRDASVHTDPSGNAIATWSQRTDGGTQVLPGAIYRTTAARYTASTGTWGSPLTIQDANRIGYFPYLGVDDRGRAVVMWTQQSGRTVNGVPVKEIRSDRVTPQ